MTITVRLPGPLREAAGGHATLEFSDTVHTVREALDTIRRRYPAVYDRIVTETGELRPHVNLFVGSQHIHQSGGVETQLRDGDEITILPAVSGGQSTKSE